MMNLIGPILEIIGSTLHLIEEKKRTKYMKKYHQLLTDINELENLPNENFDDAKLDHLYMELLLFTRAFSSELKPKVSSDS